jgi:outer membrane murein-binding lipoprotein Lpp
MVIFVKIDIDWRILMKLFNWSNKKDQQDKEIQTQVDFLQAENDQLLDQVESLKLDISEAQSENEHLREALNRSTFRQGLIKMSIGMAVLIVSYALLVLIGERNTNLPWLLLIEAAFLFLMLNRGEGK